MNHFLNFYRSSDKLIFFSFMLTFLFILTIINAFALFYDRLPTRIPLFYTLPWGDPQLVSLPQFYILPLSLLLITLINLIISWHLHESQIVLKRLLALTTAVCSLLLTITTLNIIFIFV